MVIDFINLIYSVWHMWFYSHHVFLFQTFEQSCVGRITWEWEGTVSLISPAVLTYSAIYTQYHKTSSISRTKSQSLNVSCILLQLSSLDPLKPGVKLRMKM